MTIQLFTSVASMATARSIRVLSRVALANDGPRTTKNQVAYEGEWLGHAAGEFEFTREVFEKIIANFERRDDSIPLTYGHPNGETAAYMGAAGWIHGLTLGTDDKGRLGLFAEMEFSERAASQVRAGEQRYCSVVVTFDGIDEKSGEPIGPELYEVGLVLSAFVDGMTPLAASRVNRTTPARGGNKTRSYSMSTIDILKQAIKDLPEDASPAQVTAYIEAEAAKQAAVMGDEAAPEEAPAEEAELSDAPAEGAQVVAAMDEMPAEEEEEAAASLSSVETIVAEVSAQGGDADAMSIDAFLEERAADIAAMFLGAPDDGTAADDMGDDMAEFGKSSDLAEKALAKQLADAKAENAKLSKRIATIESDGIAAQVDAAIESQAIGGDSRDEWIELGRVSPSLFTKQLAKVSAHAPPAGVPLSKTYKPKTPADSRGAMHADTEPQDDEERDFVAKLSKRGVKGEGVITRLSFFREERAKQARQAARG